MKWAWAHKTLATFFASTLCVPNHRHFQSKVSENARNIFAGIFEDLESRSINRRSLACQIELTLWSTICSGDTGGLTKYKNPGSFCSARFCVFVDSIFVEVRRARLCEILAAPTGMTVST